MRRMFIVCIAGILGVLFFLTDAYSAGDIKFKILAVNPSSTKPTKTLISQPLPSEIDPAQDLIDKAGLDVKFDPDRKVYVMTKEVELGPKETKVFEVRVRDIWQVTPDQVEEIKSDLTEQIVALKDTKYYDTGKLLYEKAQEGLDRVIEEQSRPVGVKQHIERYRAHREQLAEIKKNALSMDAMRRLEEEKKKGVEEARFVIDASNPESEPKEMAVRSFLPKEVGPDDVLDSQDFDVLYDESKKLYYLEKKEKFGAKENKKYIITVKNKWKIPDEDIRFYKEQTEKLMTLFRDTSFSKYADDQGKIILDMLSEVSRLQQEVASALSLEERMRAFILNSQKAEIIKAKIDNLQKLFPEASLEKNPERDFAERLKNLIRKLAETKNLVLMAIGISPNKPITWWLIFGIILFLGAFATIFYFTWIKKLQETKWGKKVMEATSSNPASAPPPPPQEAQTSEKKS